MLPVVRAIRAPGRVLLALVACSALTASALLPGCAVRSGAKRARPVAPLQRVVVFPLNVVATLPADVESGVGPVSEELRAHLEARGLEIESIGLGEAREAWLQSAAALKAEVGADKMSFDGVASTLSRQLATTHRFDGLILPWIVVGPATMKTAGVVGWDGVKRKLQLAQVGSKRRSAWAFKRFREQFSGIPVSASSLMLAVYSNAGAKLCSGAGGLELLVEVSLEVEARAVSYEWVPRPENFQDRDHLHEAIALAFASCPGAAP